MIAVLVFFTGCKDKNTQVSLTDKAENNKGKTINQRMIFPKSIGGNSRNKIVVSFIC